HTRHCIILDGDLSQADILPELTNKAIGVYGHIDVVIHSAGISQRSTAKDTSMDTIRKIMEVNFFAGVAITKYLLPHFAERRDGHIVAISSMAGLMGFPMRTGYAASKHAVKGYFETMQTEADIPGLDITIVSPGRINTPISLSAITPTGELHGKMDEELLNGIPVSECAEKILKGVAQKRKHIIVARNERYLWWFWWFWHSIYLKIAHKEGMRQT
ncbi:MAG TPA: SDR family NAD(P)-dependent oxidoreductase, partial [Chitinophagaceae bacterium]|nr:SDR family NAD(P)-dependent oxidoreductase [Chitinophagaceae bacterium]